MKHVLILFFFLYCNSLIGQNLIESSKDFGLIGNVKKVDEKSYSLTFISMIDKNGKLIEQSKLNSHKVLSFNNRNMLVEEFEKKKYRDINCQYIYDASDSLIDIKYNHQSSLSRRLNKISDLYKQELMSHKGILKNYKYTSTPSKNVYNSNGELLKVYYQNRSYNKIKISSCNFLYDNDNLASINCYNDNEELFSTRDFFYNKSNKISKEIYSILNSLKSTEKKTYFFNDIGVFEREYIEIINNEKTDFIVDKVYENFNVINNTTTNYIKNTIRKELRKYDLKDNLLSYILTQKKGDTLLYRNTELYSYDNNSNRLSSQKTFFGPQTDYSIKEKLKYKYDKNGNWIIKCNYIDDAPVKTTLRNIDYYISTTNKVVEKNEAILFCDSKYDERLESLKKEVEKNYKEGLVEKEVKN